MSDFPDQSPDEEPRQRFRRLLSENEQVGADGLPPWGEAPESSPVPDPAQTPPPATELPAWGNPSEPEPIPGPLEEFPPVAGDTAPVRTRPQPDGQTRPAAPYQPDPGQTVPSAPARPGGGYIPPRPAARPIEEPPANQQATRPSLRSQPESTPPPMGQTTRPARPYGSQPPPPGEYPALPPLRRPPPQEPYQAPLPRRVNEVDVDATRVTPSAYTPGRAAPGTPRRISPPGARRPLPPPPRPVVEQPLLPGNVAGGTSRDLRKSLGCLLRVALAVVTAFVVVVLCTVSFMFLQYYRIASTLPDIRNLPQKASQFETTRILDRNGNSLYEIIDPQAGRRTYVTLSKISPYLVAATVATEDRGFYNHPGVDLFAIARAFWMNFQSGETVSGASTITQQLVRNLLFTPEERVDQSYSRKLREAILATEVTRRYSKDVILELYLNENNYGNLAYGVEAAAETYFNTSADKLTLGQAAFLAGLPQAPYIYDVYTRPDVTFKRMESVLVLMYEASQEQGGIRVSNSPQPIYLDPVTITTAAAEIRNYEFKLQDAKMRYPHWVTFIRAQLEEQFDAQTIYRSGFTVYTTLDPDLQDAAQQIISDQVASLANRNATGGALVAVQPSTGEILAMVGSPDFYNEAISGQVNMAINPRQPGSAIKPLTYAAAFEKGWTPATLLWDVPSEFPPSGRSDDLRPPYKPINYDNRFHGPVTVRSALANSYNIPAVKALDFIGIYDHPDTPAEDGFLAYARRLGISTLNLPDYGLSLTLGGGDVSLLELTGAYATFANSGRRMPLVAIKRVLDHNGQVVYEYKPPQGEQVIRFEHAFLISSILSDQRARAPMFGATSVLDLPFPAAAKTGTTNDFRDNWTLGYTPDLAVGVWIGNANYTPMNDLSGVAGAAPAWAQFMRVAVQELTNGHPKPFMRPAGVVEHVICEASGTRPSEWCPKQRTEIFAADQPPLPAEEDLWRKVRLDTWTGLLASAACPDSVEEQFVLNVRDSWAIKWIRQDPQGQAWAEGVGFPAPVTFIPTRECKTDDSHPSLTFVSPLAKARIINSPVEIFVVAAATQGFEAVDLEFGLGAEPVAWQHLERRTEPINQPALIYTWDVSRLPAGPVTLRLVLHSKEGTRAEKRLHLDLQVPTPTPTPTPSATSTLSPTPTSTPTQTVTPSATPSITPTPSPTHTPSPTNTPAPTDTPTPTETPTVTASVTADKFPKATASLTPTPESGSETPPSEDRSAITPKQQGV